MPAPDLDQLGPEMRHQALTGEARAHPGLGVRCSVHAGSLREAGL